jgi:CBS domain containing-hemolysin-like protein
MTWGLLLIVVIVFILLEAFFSGSEFSFVSCNRPKILRLAKENHTGAILAKTLLSKPEQLFSTTVVGTTLTINILSCITTLFIIKNFGYSKEWLNLIFLTPIILIFGEFVPKMYAKAKADTLVLKLGKPLLVFSFLLYPITKFFNLYAKFLKNIFGMGTHKDFFLSREEIKAAIPTSRESDVTANEQLLIERIFEFDQKKIKDILRPLIEVIAIEETKTVKEGLKLIIESGHSRLPVYRERIDNIVGLLVAFDCLKAEDLQKPIHQLMQPAFFVPESKNAEELLDELKSKPMAIAVNEFGGAEGIITQEDVVEEIVGEIEDEYDEPVNLIKKIAKNTYLVDARIEIDDLKDALKLNIPKDEDYQTLSGFLLKRMQKIPKKWDSMTLHSVEYIIQNATDRTIEEVCIVLKN